MVAKMSVRLRHTRMERRGRKSWRIRMRRRWM
jgi:hypothetical protein